jgi:hypothetical protein
MFFLFEMFFLFFLCFFCFLYVFFVFFVFFMFFLFFFNGAHIECNIDFSYASKTLIYVVYTNMHT